jgi:hypothetical protein
MELQLFDLRFYPDVPSCEDDSNTPALFSGMLGTACTNGVQDRSK